MRNVGVPESDRPKIIEWMKLLEMAQLLAATQSMENSGEEFSEEQQAHAPDPALIEAFNKMVEEMFDYGRSILMSQEEKIQKKIFISYSKSRSRR